VPERLVLVPPWAFSPDALRLIPAERGARAALEDRFEIDIVRWPMLLGEQPASETWEAAVIAVQRQLTPGCHVVCTGGSATSAIMAISRDGNRVRSLVIEGLLLSGATLHAAGYDSLAALVPLILPREKSWVQQVARLTVAGGGEDLVERLAEQISDDLDWELTRKLSESWAGWNIFDEQPRVTVPALFLRAGLPVAGYDETLALLRRFATRVEVDQLELWPTQNHLPEAGAELAHKVIDFIDRVNAARS
jgi:hypothetical protein